MATTSTIMIDELRKVTVILPPCECGAASTTNRDNTFRCTSCDDLYVAYRYGQHVGRRRWCPGPQA